MSETIENVAKYLNYSQWDALNKAKDKIVRYGAMWKADLEEELRNTYKWEDNEDRLEELITAVTDSNGKTNQGKIEELCTLAEQNLISEVIAEPSHCDKLELTGSMLSFPEDDTQNQDGNPIPLRANSTEVADDMEELNAITDTKQTLRKMANRINELVQELTQFKYYFPNHRSKQKTPPAEVENAVRSLPKISSRMENLISSLMTVENEKNDKIEETDKMQYEIRALQHEFKLKDEYIANLEAEINSLSRIFVILGTAEDEHKSKDVMFKAQLASEQANAEEAIQKAEQAEVELKNAKVLIESLQDDVKKQLEVINVLGSKPTIEEPEQDEANPESKEGLLDEVRLLQRTITMFSSRDDTRNKDLVAKQQKINELESQMESSKRDLEKQAREIIELKELNKTLATKADEASQASLKTGPRASVGGGFNRMSVFNSSKDSSMRQSTFNSRLNFKNSARKSSWPICCNISRQL